MQNSSDNILLEFLLLAILVLINAFFSSAEMAIVSLNKNKIAHLAGEGNKRAVLLQRLLQEPSRFLATIQVGITLAGFLASATAATSISQPISNVLRSWNVPASDNIALVLVTIFLSYITLVFGELLPKRIALHNSEKIALSAAKSLLVISKIVSPFVKVLTVSSNFLLRVAGIDPFGIEERVSEEEIRMMIDVGEENGVLNQTEREMIDGIFEFDNTLAKEVMTPRTSVFAIHINTPIEAMIEEISYEQYSRIPVYDEDIDNIIGILYMKDLFIKMCKGRLEQEVIKELLRIPHFVPETKNIDTLFRELQNTNNHMAILIDEYGGFSGIVTIEDLIEEIVGNISDEYDEEKNEDIKKLDANTYLVKGLVPIDEVNEVLNTKLPSEYFDTIGGFVIDILGSIPKENEEHIVEYENLTFKVEKVEEKRIELLKICINYEEGIKC